MAVSIIAAVARNGVIGRENRLPWHLPRDLKRFRALTWDKAIVMGRRTFASLGRPLDGRRNIVLTHRSDFAAEGVEVAHSLAEALGLAQAGDREVMVIGGAEVFREALPLASKVYLTVVEGDFPGDVRFPADVENDPQWGRTSEESWPADAKNPHPHRFAVYERRPAGEGAA